MKACTLMPGLMDIHLHCSAHNPITYKNYRVAQLEVTPPLQMLTTLLHQQIMLEMGFTTLRDNPGRTPTAAIIRRSSSPSAMPWKRASSPAPGWWWGYATMTGSHLDLIVPRGCRREPDATADGPWELRKLAGSNCGSASTSSRPAPREGRNRQGGAGCAKHDPGRTRRGRGRSARPRQTLRVPLLHPHGAEDGHKRPAPTRSTTACSPTTRRSRCWLPRRSSSSRRSCTAPIARWRSGAESGPRNSP